MVKTIGYIGSNGLEVTEKPMQNIIPDPPEFWTMGYTLKKFSFYNETGCNVVINNKFPISLSAGRGFETDYEDVPITSFVIVEKDTPYEFIGSY